MNAGRCLKHLACISITERLIPICQIGCNTKMSSHKQWDAMYATNEAPRSGRWRRPPNTHHLIAMCQDDCWLERNVRNAISSLINLHIK